MSNTISYNHKRLVITDPQELETAPRTAVCFGTAPDGLPWLLSVDRSHKLESLFSTVVRVFGLNHPDELPERVLNALAADVASGLMGIHPIEWGDETRKVYVCALKAKALLGPTIMSQALDTSRPPASVPPAFGNAPNTLVGATFNNPDEQYIEAVERSIEALRAKRHLMIDLDNASALTGGVRDSDKALRTPRAPFRDLTFESLIGLGAVARLHSVSGSTWSVPVDEHDAYLDRLLRLNQSPGGGYVDFQLSRLKLLQYLARWSCQLGQMHNDGLIHGDIAPGNLLLGRGGFLSFDSLDLKKGDPAPAATFDWASPEQIVGHPLDPRADVFALAKIAAALLGAVPFGEETRYIVPIGGPRSRTVRLLKCEGVFVDILETDHNRAWQLAWQDFLGRSMAFDVKNRPVDGDQFGRELASLIEAHPPDGVVDCRGHFGQIVHLDGAGSSARFARILQDV